MGFDRKAPLPLFYQLKEAIKLDLVRQHTPLMAKIPPIEALSRQYGVAKATANRAVAELCKEGILDSKPGRGTIMVMAPPQQTARQTLTTLLHPHDEIDPMRTPYAWHVCMDILQGVSAACDETGFAQQLLFRSEGAALVGKLADATLLLSIGFLSRSLQDVVDELHIPQIVCTVDPWDLRKTQGISYVTSSLFEGARMATGHLAQTGCRTIGFIGGPFHKHGASVRFNGYQHALQERGLEISETLVAECGQGEEAAAAAMGSLLERRPDLDAVFVIDDIRAVAAVTAIHGRGLKTPGDVSVVGFDDFPEAARCNPPLTTIRHPRYRIGYEALKTLLSIQAGILPAPCVRELPNELVIRETTRSDGMGR